MQSTEAAIIIISITAGFGAVEWGVECEDPIKLIFLFYSSFLFISALQFSGVNEGGHWTGLFLCFVVESV